MLSGIGGAEILTNFVTVLIAGVGEELQGRVGTAAALVGNSRLGLLRVITTDGDKVGRVVGVARRKVSARGSGVTESCLWRCVPNDGQETGRSRGSRGDASEGHEGQSESRLLKEHGETGKAKGADWSRTETRSRSESGEASNALIGV